MVLCIVLVSSHSFGVGIVDRLFFWILYSMRNVLKNFENFSQPAQLIQQVLLRSLDFGNTLFRFSWFSLVQAWN